MSQANLNNSSDFTTAVAEFNSGTPKASFSVCELDSEVSNAIVKGSLAGTPSILLPFPSQTLETSSAAVVSENSDEFVTTRSANSLGQITGAPTIVTQQPQLVSWSQLQAIMAAVANGGSVSVATSLASTTPITHLSGSPGSVSTAATNNSMSTLQSSTSVSPASLATVAYPHTNPTSNPLLSLNAVSATLLPPPPPPLGSTTFVGTQDCSTTMLLPAALASAGALTLTPTSSTFATSSGLNAVNVSSANIPANALKNMAVTSTNEGNHIYNTYS
ncbi:hypothetical protein AHF37_00595 [Paragonimus kellicotti]|nr:hypothetical protein AHF37_00595 [Paragonimus kellicotti]